MKAINVFLLVLMALLPYLVQAQVDVVEGRLFSKNTNQPIAFANVYNISTKKGTITNTEGYFKITVGSLSDTIKITCIGYQNYIIPIKPRESFYTIQLAESNQLLNSVTVAPKENDYLYDLVSQCKKSASSVQKKAKALYELKSFINGSQTELVEGYYNIDMVGHKVEDMQLKAGRVALRKYNNRFFASLESSKAIIMLDVFHKNAYFPTNPLELSKRKLKKQFRLYKSQAYLTADADSVFVIRYEPKDSAVGYFSGKLWINQTTKQLQKITLNCQKAKIHPFLPLFETDKISVVSFSITQTYTSEANGASIFNHTDFTYQIVYKSRVGKAEQETYAVTTNVILYAYNFEQTFFQPIFNFSENELGDYRRINALPYNDFFWTYHDEYQLNDQENVNALFYHDKKSFTNKTMFKANPYATKGVFEHPFVTWSKTRIGFQDVIIDTNAYEVTTDLKTRKYNLVVKIYLDANAYKDTLQISTATIFDPYESNYHLPIDKETHCFVNIYFDLCEIKRRELDKALVEAGHDLEKIRAIYDAFLDDFETSSAVFFKAVQRG
ncbi:MAG: carboxypeptidase-like regulatory domain-containing protein, partial [Putridiphycobacter sp.]|nr:carboxypeptidase-like regulatory domain-containing protein [Putridiphycobacter sp.]